jgi:hypothetical protein
MTAQHWAQGVMNDATVLVFYSGNFEFIGLRERETGTLYISDMLHLKEMRAPAYGELETALQTLAVREHLERFLRKTRKDEVGGEEDPDDYDDNDDDHDNGGGGSGKHNRRRKSGDEDDEGDEDHTRGPKRPRQKSTRTKSTESQPRAGSSREVRRAMVQVCIRS